MIRFVFLIHRIGAGFTRLKEGVGPGLGPGGLGPVVLEVWDPVEGLGPGGPGGLGPGEG